jgi:carboxylesterase
MSTPGFMIRELWRMVDAVKARFAAIRTPALIAHSSDDDIAGLRKNALYMQERLAGPAELLVLNDSYHMITVDQQRHLVADATARFFAGRLSAAERTGLAAAAKESLPEVPERAEDERGPGRKAVPAEPA